MMQSIKTGDRFSLQPGIFFWKSGHPESLTAAFFCADFLPFIALNAVRALFQNLRCKTAFSPNIIHPKHADQDQIDAKWLEKSLFSDVSRHS